MKYKLYFLTLFTFLGIVSSGRDSPHLDTDWAFDDGDT